MSPNTHNRKLVTSLRRKFTGNTEVANASDQTIFAAYTCWRTTSPQNWNQFPLFLAPKHRNAMWAQFMGVA